MDEDIDVSAEASVDSSATESLDVEPVVDIPVEEVPIDNIDGLNETEPPISEPEMAEMQSEAAALAIEPFEEESNSDYFELEGANTYNLAERITAGIAAVAMPFAAGASQFAATGRMNAGVPFEAPPAIYAETDYAPKTPEQVLAEFTEQPDAPEPGPFQTADEINDLTSALKEPEFGDHPDDTEGEQNDG